MKGADCFGRKQHMEPENDGFQVRNLLFQKPYFSGSTLNFRGVKENFPLEPRKNPDRNTFHESSWLFNARIFI